MIVVHLLIPLSRSWSGFSSTLRLEHESRLGTRWAGQEGPGGWEEGPGGGEDRW